MKNGAGREVGEFESYHLEQILGDVFASFWIEASREPENCELSLASALQRLVPGAEVQVVSVSCVSENGEVIIRSGGSSLGVSFCLDALAEKQLVGEERESKSENKLLVEGLGLKVFRRDSGCFGFSLASSFEYIHSELLIVRAGGLDSGGSHALWWLVNRVPEIRVMFSSFSALNRSRMLGMRLGEAEAEAVNSRVHFFRLRLRRIRFESVGLMAKLDELILILKELACCQDPGVRSRLDVDLVEVGLWVGNAILQAHWSSTDEALGNLDLPTRFFQALIEARYGPSKAKVDRESSGRFWEEDCWDVFFLLARPSSGVPGPDLADSNLLALFGLNRWYEACLVLKEKVANDEWAEQEWLRTVLALLPMVEKILKPGWHGKQARVRGLWPWLNLWMARQLMLEILRRDPSWTSILEDRWEFRMHLSLVLREGIRQSLFGDEPDFVFDSHRYLESLSHVVAHHAHQVVGIEPKFGLVRLLEQIGQGRHADDYPFAASHQQHALQVYIFGHFLLELTLEAESEDFERSGWKIKEALSAPGGSKEKPVADIRRLSQAFSLAAVHHDVGMLLFPRMFFPLADLADHGDRILASLRGVGSSILESGEAMLETCKRDLLGTRRDDGTWGEAMAEGLWDRDHGPAERDLLDRLTVETKEGREGQLETVAPDHSMLGGWYLYQLSAGMQTTDAEVVAQAVRAILFHQAFEYKISVARDPAAALLALCDEVFDWQPSTKRTSLLFAGAFRGGPVGLDVRPEGSRAKEIRLPGVEAKLAEDDSPEGLRWVLRLTERESSEGWPRIELGLKDPDVLEVPAWQIWLQLAQNLSRLEPPKDDPKGFSPIVRITSKVPGRFRLHNRKSHNMLIGARGKLRQKFERELAIWLEANEWNLAPEADREALEIRSEGKVPFETNTKAAFDELSKAVDEYRRRLDNRQRN